MDNNQVYNDNLAQMRQDMDELRSLLSEQRIVNERLMRRAMKNELNKERKSAFVSLLLFLLVLPVMYFMRNLWGLPVWFVGVTVAYLILAVALSFWSVRRLTGEDLLTGSLLSVAERIVGYKRFGNNWLKFSIPFLAVWLVGFFHYSVEGAADHLVNPMLWGGAIGGLSGLGCGIWFVVQSHRRLNGVLRQIEEMKKGAR